MTKTMCKFIINCSGQKPRVSGLTWHHVCIYIHVMKVNPHVLFYKFIVSKIFKFDHTIKTKITQIYIVYS